MAAASPWNRPRKCGQAVRWTGSVVELSCRRTPSWSPPTPHPAPKESLVARTRTLTALPAHPIVLHSPILEARGGVLAHEVFCPCHELLQEEIVDPNHPEELNFDHVVAYRNFSDAFEAPELVRRAFLFLFFFPAHGSLCSPTSLSLSLSQSLSLFLSTSTSGSQTDIAARLFQLEKLLENVSMLLKDGGYFFGYCADSSKIWCVKFCGVDRRRDEYPALCFLSPPPPTAQNSLLHSLSSFRHPHCIMWAASCWRSDFGCLLFAE